MGRPTSEAQKEKLRAAQLNYIANDPRWAAHRRKIAEAQRRPQQRTKMSQSVKAYIKHDPRWPDHRARMQEAALEATRLTLLPEEINRILELRRFGRNFEYIAEELCVSDKIIRRELRANGHSTARVKRRRATRGKGYWRSFDAGVS